MGRVDAAEISYLGLWPSNRKLWSIRLSWQHLAQEVPTWINIASQWRVLDKFRCVLVRPCQTCQFFRDPCNSCSLKAWPFRDASPSSRQTSLSKSKRFTSPAVFAVAWGDASLRTEQLESSCCADRWVSHHYGEQLLEGLHTYDLWTTP